MISDWIEFGTVSAERDENLTNYFFENGVLQSVIENRYSFLVLGRKGAGKTAVFQHLRDNPRKYLGADDLSIHLSLQDYSWNVHKLLATDGSAPSLAYAQSWKYIIYLEAINALKRKGFDSTRLRKSYNLIERVYGSPVPSFVQLIGSKFLKLSKINLPSGNINFDGNDLSNFNVSGGEVEFESVKNDASLQTALNKTLERFTDIFEDALVDVSGKGIRIFISFDRIDEAWDAASFESSQKIISGLIAASEYIVRTMGGFLRPIVFLREDIFETLDINDKNKLRADCGKLLAWNKEGLSRMILMRVNFFAEKTGNIPFSRINDMFDREQMRQQKLPFDYILGRTMLRPRDFIRFFDLIRSDMRERKDNPFGNVTINEARLECQSVYNAEAAYSEWLVEELRDEWRAQFPRINDLFSAIQNNGNTNFSMDDLSLFLQKNGKTSTSIEVAHDIKFLFDNSIIGFRIGNAQQWKFKCFFNSQGYVESPIYKVHDGLNRGLNLREKRASPT